MKKSKKSTGKRSSLSQGVLTNNSKTSTVSGSTIIPTTPLQNLVLEEIVQMEVPEDGTAVRGHPPCKIECVSLPKVLPEISLAEKDNKQALKDSTESMDAGVLGIDLSHGDSEIEQNTVSFNSQSSVKVISQASPSAGMEIQDRPYVESKPDTEEISRGDIVSTDSQENCESTYVKPPSPAAKGKGSVKKKRYLPVQSRYMQQANNNSNNSSNSNSTLELSAIPSNSEGKNKENRRLKKNTGISHSTPYLQEQTMFTYSDGSFMDTTALKKKETTAVAAAAAKKDRRKTCMSTNELRKPKEKEQTPVSQLQMDIYHCRNLQMAFLLAQTRQTMEAEEQKVKEELYAMSQANARLKQEIFEINQKMLTKDAETAVDLLLRAQVDGLEEVHKKLPELTIGMSQLTSAVRNTAKYMKMENIILDEEKHLEAMEETKRLLSQIVALTVRNQPGIEGLSAAALDLKSAVLAQLEQQKMCLDLLTTYKSLNNQERSLMAQILQCSNSD